MLSRFLPEGRRLETPENLAACSSLSGLLSARDRGQILEGMALSCSPEHDLTVSLGPVLGVIPRPETAVGVAEGTVRDIAILSRVGKPVCFLVEEVQEGPEGCLSIPGKYGLVKRPFYAKVRAQDRNGNFFEVEGEDIVARCFCHEIDHLDGHLFSELTDRLYTNEELDELMEAEGEEQA